MAEQGENPPKQEKKSDVIANYPDGLAFRDRQRNVTVLPDARQREGDTFKEKSQVHENDFHELAYDHAESKEEDKKNQHESAELARKILKEFKAGNHKPIGTGFELEGTLYDNNGNLLTVHDEENVTFDLIPPEADRAQLEVVSGKTDNGEYPSSALDIAKVLGKTVQQGEKVAELRKGNYVIASVPEGGSPEQLGLTDHPKIISSFERGQTGVYDGAPQETKNIAKELGLDKQVPYNGTHVHTSNPELPNGKFDARAAYAAGILETTQMAQVENFMLANTRDYLGMHMDNMKDVRSIMKRGLIGAQDTNLPNNSYSLNENAIEAMRSGIAHQFSRGESNKSDDDEAAPVKGQHDKVRIMKEFGTVESVAGSANPDLRLIMAHVYFKQLTRVLSYKVLEANGGDESKVITYLQNDYKDGKYGYLFEELKTKEAPNSSFEQDLRFNEEGFEAKGNNDKTYAEQIQDIREIVRDLGDEFPAFELQAQVVDHVLGKVAEPAQRGIGLSQYMDVDSGMKSGIVTDYKFGNNIPENIRVQAEGTKKQMQKLQKVETDQDLLKFFGIGREKALATPRRHADKPHSRRK